jgi:magnesium chelatase accessory protein
MSVRDLADWPNAHASRFVRATGLDWHVQIMGKGPVMLLVHGTGAATHSWRDMLPELARDFTVVAPDLPGHGFTSAPPGHLLSLPGMARDLAGLLSKLGMAPVIAVGHSAGAAILCRMSLDGALPSLRALVSLNGAMLPLDGAPGKMFAPLARLLVGLPLVPQLFAWRAGDRKVVEKLLAGTGSKIDARGIDLYARVVRRPAHAAAALRMMANWDLNPLVRDLPRLSPPLHLIAGGADRAIPPSDSARVRDMIPGATLAIMPGLGHLAHEEDFVGTAALIRDYAQAHGLVAA